jgi:uncharacterized protein YxjI
MIHSDGEHNHLYRMQQKLISFGNDYWIVNAQGQRVFFVDSKTFFLREHLGFKDVQGNELLSIQEKVMHIKDTYSIFRSGNTFATIKKILITPYLQRFEVHVAGAENMEVEGNIREYEYKIHEGQKCVAEVSKRWFDEAVTYGVLIHHAANHILILAVTVIVDMMLD